MSRSDKEMETAQRWADFGNEMLMARVTERSWVTWTARGRAFLAVLWVRAKWPNDALSDHKAEATLIFDARRIEEGKRA